LSEARQAKRGLMCGYLGDKSSAGVAWLGRLSDAKHGAGGRSPVSRLALPRFLGDWRLKNPQQRLRPHRAVHRHRLEARAVGGLRPRARVRGRPLHRVLGACRLHGVHPWGWFHDVLPKLAAGSKRSRIAQLIPSSDPAPATA